MKILLIEDNRRMAGYVGRVLEDEGHVVETAHDGETGLELALKDDVDLVVLDLMLPRRPGLEVLDELRRSKKTPVLIVSDMSQYDGVAAVVLR